MTWSPLTGAEVRTRVSSWAALIVQVNVAEVTEPTHTAGTAVQPGPFRLKPVPAAPGESRNHSPEARLPVVAVRVAVKVRSWAPVKGRLALLPAWVGAPSTTEAV